MRAERDPAPIHLQDRILAPREPDPGRMRDSFFVALRHLTLGLIHGDHWRVRLGPLTLHEFGEPVPGPSSWRWPIRGGLLTGRPGGSLSFEWRGGQLLSTVDGYWPSLPRPLYRATQLQLHHTLTRLFLLQLRGRVPPPGVPAGAAQRLAAASLDLALCTAATSRSDVRSERHAVVDVPEALRKPRMRPRTDCDQCDGDYSEEPDRIGTVTVEWHPLYWQTLCATCAGHLGVTGYPTALGTRQRPRDWPHAKPSGEAVLDCFRAGAIAFQGSGRSRVFRSIASLSGSPGSQLVRSTSATNATPGVPRGESASDARATRA